MQEIISLAIDSLMQPGDLMLDGPTIALMTQWTSMRM